MTIFTDAGTIRSATTPKRTVEVKVNAETGTIRSKATVTATDHYCIYIPTFDWSAALRWDYADHGIGKRWAFDGEPRWAYFVELNPQANPC